MIIRVLVIILTGLALIAPAAHLFGLRKKIVMPKDEYFVVQKIYIGWWLAGLFLPAAFLANVALAVEVGTDASAFWFAASAAMLILLNLTIFVDLDTADQQSHPKLDRPGSELASRTAPVGAVSCRQSRRDISGVMGRDAGGVIRLKLRQGTRSAQGTTLYAGRWQP